MKSPNRIFFVNEIWFENERRIGLVVAERADLALRAYRAHVMMMPRDGFLVFMSSCGVRDLGEASVSLAPGVLFVGIERNILEANLDP